MYLYYDSRNRPVFPTSGASFRGNAKYLSNPKYHPVGYLSLDYHQAHNVFGKVSMVHQFFGGLVAGDTIPYQYNFLLGGQTATTNYGNVPFSGYKFAEIGAEATLFYQLDIQYNLMKNISVSLNGNLGIGTNDMMNIFKDFDFISGIGATAGIITKIGPIMGSISWSPQMRGVVGFFQLGYAF